ncbi:hypothetical protein [Pseudalkalibacillus sp. SCS-8]|uniref:hypothetical protein n=1 Tax=Pseudalkalibacillus nanhaiensis TaxID=3115291 RepID=UPI0032D9EF5B
MLACQDSLKPIEPKGEVRILLIRDNPVNQTNGTSSNPLLCFPIKSIADAMRALRRSENGMLACQDSLKPIEPKGEVRILLIRDNPVNQTNGTSSNPLLCFPIKSIADAMRALRRSENGMLACQDSLKPIEPNGGARILLIRDNPVNQTNGTSSNPLLCFPIKSIADAMRALRRSENGMLACQDSLKPIEPNGEAQLYLTIKKTSAPHKGTKVSRYHPN